METSHQENYPDTEYLASIYKVSSSLSTAFQKWLNVYEADVDSLVISDAVARRLKAYYQSHTEAKEFLDKGSLASGADFFVETVLFFLKVHLANSAKQLRAVSEKEILVRKYKGENDKTKREVLKPDIAVYDGEKLIAIIECKTQLGRSRATWEAEHKHRKQKLASIAPNAKAFLLVMTASNWPGFGSNPLIGSEYFCLLDKNTWPIAYNEAGQIETPIEKLFSCF